jgi:hypothetical protein
LACKNRAKKVKGIRTKCSSTSCQGASYKRHRPLVPRCSSKTTACESTKRGYVASASTIIKEKNRDEIPRTSICYYLMLYVGNGHLNDYASKCEKGMMHCQIISVPSQGSSKKLVSKARGGEMIRPACGELETRVLKFDITTNCIAVYGICITSPATFPRQSPCHHKISVIRMEKGKSQDCVIRH